MIQSVHRRPAIRFFPVLHFTGGTVACKLRLFCILAAGLLATGLSTQCLAEALKVQTGSETLEGIHLATSATTPEGAKLTLVGAGLRQKKVVLVNVNVYVAELFVADASKLKKTNAEVLNSISAAQPAAIQLHFLRDVDADKVQNSFREAMEANKIDMKKPEIQKVLDAVKMGGEAKKGQTLTLVTQKNSDGTESVTYEAANGKSVTMAGAAGLSRDLFSIWLGQPSDDGVARLKASILK